MSFRVASTKPEEVHTGATFAPGDEAVGFDPSNPEDARKLEEGLFVESGELGKPADLFASPEAEAKAEELGVDPAAITGRSGKNGTITVADVEKAYDNQEEN